MPVRSAEIRMKAGTQLSEAAAGRGPGEVRGRRCHELKKHTQVFRNVLSG